MTYLTWRMRQAAQAGEGYGSGHINEPEHVPEESLANPIIASCRWLWSACSTWCSPMRPAAYL